MANVVVVGAQWGDEGKGKIVDWLSERADVIARFQGGHNAGHTLVIGNQVYKLSLLPSGIVRAGKMAVIGNGVVLDPWALFSEIDKLSGQGVQIGTDNLMIAENTPLILPLHQDLDRLREEAAGAAKIGTTGRGIGPAYEDKVGRRTIRVADLGDEETLDQRLDRLLAHHDPLRAGLGAEPVDRAELKARLIEIAPKLLPYAQPVWKVMADARKAGKRILFEGAQGTLLDVDHGTYPYVTSSNAISAGACTGAGIPPTRIDRVIAILKAFTTRVGEGPFPTELHDEVGDRLREIGGEFGTTTGRPRRIGWLDTVIGRYATRVNGVTDFVVTKLDNLDTFDEIPVCVAYDIDGERVEEMPENQTDFHHAKPIYEMLPGWNADITGCRTFEDLPENAQRYIEFVEKQIGARVSVIGVGPGRDEVIVRHDLLND